MALGMSPQRLREVRFAEQWRGYRTDEVDDFVDRVAEAFDALEARVREATARAERAEQALHERGPDDHVSRTLVLAQRTADAALREAEAEGARLLDEATRRAEELVANAEERAALQRSEMDARAAAELHDLIERRRALEADVALLADYVQRQRAALAEELRAQVRWLESGDHLASPPVSGPWTGAGIRLSSDEATTAEGESVADRREPDDAGDEAPSDDELSALVTRAEALQRRFSVPDAAPSDAASTAAPVVSGEEGSGEEGTGGGMDVEGSAGEPVLGAGAGEPMVAPGEVPAVAAPSLDQREPDRDPSSGDQALASEPPAPTDLEQIPWRRPEAPEVAEEPTPARSTTAPVDDDPFIAELRRAVDDPEPLGPREDDDVWLDDIGLTGPEEPLSGRRRRRRQR